MGDSVLLSIFEIMLQPALITHLLQPLSRFLCLRAKGEVPEDLFLAMKVESCLTSNKEGINVNLMHCKL